MEAGPIFLNPALYHVTPPQKNLLGGKDRMSKDISGSPWPVTRVLRPPKAQELLRDLESACASTAGIWKMGAPLPSSDSCHSEADFTFSSTSLGMLGRHPLPQGIPGGSVVRDLPASAGHGSLPWFRKISAPHAAGQLSPCPTTSLCSRAREPQLLKPLSLEPRLLRQRTREATRMRSLCIATGEEPLLTAN